MPSMRSWIKCALWIFLLRCFPWPAAAQDGKLAKAREEKKVGVYKTTTIPDMQKIIYGFKKKIYLLGGRVISLHRRTTHPEDSHRNPRRPLSRRCLYYQRTSNVAAQGCGASGSLSVTGKRRRAKSL